MNTSSIILMFEDNEKYLIEAESFSIGVEEEDGAILNINSFYAKESINNLKDLLAKKITKVSIIKNDENIYESEEWTKIDSIAIHYNDYYNKMMVNYILGE